MKKINTKDAIKVLEKIKEKLSPIYPLGESDWDEIIFDTIKEIEEIEEIENNEEESNKRRKKK